MENKLLRKEQCPDCAETGGDTSKHNMAIYSDGQTHCSACNKHGFVEHTNKVAVPEETSSTDDWLTEYRGEFYSLPDRRLRAETLEKYKVKAEKDEKGAEDAKGRGDGHVVQRDGVPPPGCRTASRSGRGSRRAGHSRAGARRRTPRRCGCPTLRRTCAQTPATACASPTKGCGRTASTS